MRLFPAVATFAALASASAPVDVVTSFSVGASTPQQTLALPPPANYEFGDIPGPRTVPHRHPRRRHRHCVVTPLGWGQDDAGQIQSAAKHCGIDGLVTLPAPFVYTIKSRMYMKLVRSQLDILGTLSFAPDLGYWIGNSHRIQFQNQSTAWIVEGEDFIINGGGWMQGGIDGNGQAWYTYAKGQSNVFGRPIPLTIYNSSNVTVQNFSLRDPMFWSFYIQDSNNVVLESIYINGTNTDPNGNSSNYAVNIDGFDSVRVNNMTVQNWLFHGGDDCAAPKGNSSNLVFCNMTCVGGGIAFGSVGQFPGAPDYIANVSASDISVAAKVSPQYGGSNVSAGAYFKSWVGVAAGVPPQGGGGGTGRVWNIDFANLVVENTTEAVYINKCYYKVPSQANDCDTSTLEFEDLSFKNVRGRVTSDIGVSLNCSAAAPCRNLRFANLHLSGHPGVYCDNTRNVVGVKCN